MPRFSPSKPVGSNSLELEKSLVEQQSARPWTQIIVAFVLGMLISVALQPLFLAHQPPSQTLASKKSEPVEIIGTSKKSDPVEIIGRTAVSESVDLETAAPTKGGNITTQGYRYGDKYKCDKTKLHHVVTAAEHARGTLDPQSLSQIVETFRNCGVVAIEGAIGLQDAKDFREDLERVHPAVAAA